MNFINGTASLLEGANDGLAVARIGEAEVRYSMTGKINVYSQLF
jgi:hypothetical protein